MSTTVNPDDSHSIDALHKCAKLKPTIDRKIAENDDCVICLESLQSTTAICETVCNHLFHSQCLAKSFVKVPQIRCPICRTNIQQDGFVNPSHSDDDDDDEIIEMMIRILNTDQMVQHLILLQQENLQFFLRWSRYLN